MIIKTDIRKGAYFDSVTLMRVGKQLAALDGVADAAIVMGTEANKGILKSSGLLTPDLSKAADADLLIAVKARDAKSADAAMKTAGELLKQSSAPAEGSAAEARPTSLDGAVQVVPNANMAVISVAGRYAGALAMQCLRKGLHVMLFSDNVPLEQEIALKKFAKKQGLLVMGPDCGTAIINGVPLAFANVVRRGGIGVVAAAGTGLQEVTTLISNAGGGISQAIGTGGRDVKKDVGGIMFVEAMKALADDADTKVILLVSKPPDKKVLAAINRCARGIRKPVVSFLIGAPAKGGPATLEEAALMAVEMERGGRAENALRQLADRDRDLRITARREALTRGRKQKYIRGLFSGGTFCAEAQILLGESLSGLHSNAPTGKAAKLKNSLKSVQHSFVDLGEDEFTVGRPHPMIDFSLRNKRILEEASDSETAVILLDVVLGYGSNMDPAAELAPVIRKAARTASVVCSVTGTDGDPQNRSAVAKALADAGAIVMPSNAAACRLAGEIVKGLER